jgi:trigger factor
MHITKENVGELNAFVTIKLDPQDYESQYNHALKDYRKKINLPGFRVGQVPMGIVKKKYGKSVLAEEINKVLQKSMQTYIADNKIDVLGSPLPSAQHKDSGDWDNPVNFEFVFEMGLAPKFEINIDKTTKLTYPIVKVEDKIVDEEIVALQRRHGVLSDAEISSEKDMLIGDFSELDEAGNTKENGIKNSSTISLEFLKDEDVVKSLVGLSVGNNVEVDPHKVSQGHDDLGKMLAISHDEVHDLKSRFKFTIVEIKTMKLAELDQELFDKVYPNNEVKSVEELRNKIKQSISEILDKESEKVFKSKLNDKLDELTKIELPDTFLKRWIMATNEKPVTAEQIENEYPFYSKGLRHQLIQNKIVVENKLEVKPEEALEYAKSMITEQYAQYGLPKPADEELTDTAKKWLGKEGARGVYEKLYDEKVATFVKEKASIEQVELSYEEFIKF